MALGILGALQATVYGDTASRLVAQAITETDVAQVTEENVPVITVRQKRFALNKGSPWMAVCRGVSGAHRRRKRPKSGRLARAPGGRIWNRHRLESGYIPQRGRCSSRLWGRRGIPALPTWKNSEPGLAPTADSTGTAGRETLASDVGPRDVGAEASIS